MTSVCSSAVFVRDKYLHFLVQQEADSDIKRGEKGESVFLMNTRTKAEMKLALEQFPV